MQRYTRTSGLFAALLLGVTLSACGDDKLESPEVQLCSSLGLESTQVDPLSTVALTYSKPELEDGVERSAQDLTIALEIDGKHTGYALLRFQEDDELVWDVPYYPEAPMEGGNLRLLPSIDAHACDPIDVRIHGLTPAPGASLQFMELTTRILDAQIDAFSLDRTQVLNALRNPDEVDSLPLLGWPLAAAYVLTDHPDEDLTPFSSIQEAMENSADQEWVTILDAIIAAQYDFERLEEQITYLESLPYGELSYRQAAPSTDLLRLQSTAAIPGLGSLIPEIDSAAALSDLMITSFTNCAAFHEALNWGGAYDATTAVLGALGVEVKELNSLIKEMDKNEARGLPSWDVLIDNIDGLSREHVDRAKSAAKSLKKVFKVITVMEKMVWGMREYARFQCELLPSEILSLNALTTPWIISEEESETQVVEISPIAVQVQSQEYEWFSHIADFLPDPRDHIMSADTKDVLDLSEQLGFHEGILKATGDLLTNYEHLVQDQDEILNSENYLQLLDIMEDAKKIGPLHWNVEIHDFRAGGVEYVEWSISDTLVVQDIASPSCARGLCFRGKGHLGTDYLTLSLFTSLFPEWRFRADDAAPTFSQIHEPISVESIVVEIEPGRLLVEPGDEVTLSYTVRNTDDPSLSWTISAGTFAGGSTTLTTDASQGEVTIALPLDDDAFPILVSAQSHGIPNEYRGDSAILDVQNIHLSPGLFCVDEGQRVPMEVHGAYPRNSSVTWHTSAGEIDVTGDNTATLVVPDESPGDITVTATVRGESSSGVPLETTTSVTYPAECTCWWNGVIDGGAGGVLGGTRGILFDGNFFGPADTGKTIILDDELNLVDGDPGGIFLGLSTPTGSDIQVGQIYDTALDMTWHLYSGGSAWENDLGFQIINQTTFTQINGPIHYGTFRGHYFTLKELLNAPYEDRAPVPSLVEIQFAVDAENSCFTGF